MGTHIEVTATVTNVGDFYSGKEVLQVYYSAPRMGTGEAVLGKPGKVLAAFDKTGLLEPGESQTLTMTFPISDMASFDDTGVTGHKNCVAVGGPAITTSMSATPSRTPAPARSIPTTSRRCASSTKT